MTDEEAPAIPHGAAAGASPRPADAGRRRFATAGASAVLLTLPSRSFAQLCKSPSGFVSGNTSSPGQPVCSGQTPDSWARQLNNTSAPGDATFAAVFPNGNNVDWAKATFYEVLHAGDNGNTGKQPNPISKEFVAIYLDITGGSIPESILTVRTLQHMWSQWSTTGFFSPTAGATWTTNELINYLQTLYA